ncbi:hypothetical protein, partial [Ralstonia pseudosolanacearum]
LERHHLEFVLGGRRALEHPAIKYKGLAEGEAFVSNLRPRYSGLFFRAGAGIQAFESRYPVHVNPSSR